ncbi:unnamed protein product, partial [Ectocarpus fasciculatus]
TNGRGSEWDVRSEQRVYDFDVGAPPARSAWDPADPSNFAVISRGGNDTYLMRNDDSGRGGFRKGYTRSPDKSLTATCAEWSRSEHGVLVAGWTDGRVSFSSSPSVGKGGGKGGKTKLVFPSEDGGSVVDLRQDDKHDPHRGPYVLVGYSSGTVVLWDAAGHHSVAAFDRCAVGLAGIRWMAWAPGNFLVLSSKTAVGKVFNISQSHAAIGTVKLGETGSGVRDMAWLPAQQPDANLGGTASAGPRAICGFLDGSLSVADTAFGGKRAWGKQPGAAGSRGGSSSSRRWGGGGGSGSIPWASKAGHVETVFSCEHRPGDPDTLATGSYGSSVKVWHVPTMDLKVTLSGQTGAIYCVAWSLDGRRIASTSGKGAVWIWDVGSGKVERQIRLHASAAHRVQWDPFQPGRLASVSADKTLVIFSDKGTVYRVYTHPEALFGCNWCPTHENVIATGCKDGKVRVFDCSWTNGLEPQYVLSGHTQRVFHVCWSPLLEGMLASGSDDATVIVWRLPRKALPRSEPAGAALKVSPTAVLRGHTSNVRPLHWNSEVPWLLLSGSWDGTVRAWDVRRAGVRWSGGNHQGSEKGIGGGGDVAAETGGGGASRREACIAVMSDHVADVYGLSASPSRPFLYASVSRDTTIRLFGLEGVASSIRTRAVLAGGSVSSALSDTASAMLPASPTALCGAASRLVETKLRGLRRAEGGGSSSSSSTAVFRRLFDFFWASDGVDILWEMVRWVGAAAATRAPNLSTTVESEAASRSLPAGRRQDRFSGGGQLGESGTAGSKPDPGSGGSWTLSLREVPEGLTWLEERVVHRDARRESDRALARLLRASPRFVVQDRRLGRSDRLERASRLCLAAGDLKGSCEAHIALGRWQVALSLAPGVGMEYWRAVADRYVKELLVGEGRGGGCVDNNGGDGGGGGQAGGADATALAAALLASTGRPMEAIRGVLEGSEEALSLAVAVADGAYPPPPEPLPREAPSSIEARAVGEAKGSDRRHTGEGPGIIAVEKETAETRGAEDGRDRDAKPRAPRDDHKDLEGGADEDLRNGGAASAEDEEGKDRALPKHKGLGSIGADTADGGSGRGRATSAGVAGGKFASIEEGPGFKEDTASALPSPQYARRYDSHPNNTSPSVTAAAAAVAAADAQRAQGEATLRSITESKAEEFFLASHPALAAATMLSICDGSRATAAPALAFLVRGEEPELAYAAAKALKFPARELTPLVREMARRAEAWGDPNLAVELLLNAGGDEESGSFERDRHTGSSSSSSRANGNNSTSGERRRHYTAEGGYWSADAYGAFGEEAGPRGAALVATRAAASRRRDGGGSSTKISTAQSSTDPCPSLRLRSRASYLEEAAAAVRRGMDVEAVRLLVLGDDLEQAAERGVCFLRENVQDLSFPPRSPHNRSASAVVRALSSGSGGGLSSSGVSPGLRMEVLAYASYIGAVEAVARGYHPVVASLLRTASTCVQAAERMASEAEATDGGRYQSDEEDDEKKNGEMGAGAAAAQHRRRSRSPGRWRKGRSTRSSSPPSHGRSRSASPSNIGGGGRRGGVSSTPTGPLLSGVFPPCMSVGALALASVQYLNGWAKRQTSAVTPSSLPAITVAACDVPRYALEVGLSWARRVRDETNHNMHAGDAKDVCDADHPAYARGTVGVAGPPTTTTVAADTTKHSALPPSKPSKLSKAGSSSSTLPTAARSSSSSSGSSGSSRSSSSSSSRSSSSDAAGESKHARGPSAEEKSNKAGGEGRRPRSGRRRRTTRRTRGELVLANNHSDRVVGNTAWSSSPSTRSPASSQWQDSKGAREIITSGSRLPSCRRHERVAWRAPRGSGVANNSSVPRQQESRPLATSSPEFGRNVWPRAKGATFLLEDGETVVGLNEAVMWAKVNPFSPLNTGCRITPF